MSVCVGTQDSKYLPGGNRDPKDKQTWLSTNNNIEKLNNACKIGFDQQKPWIYTAWSEIKFKKINIYRHCGKHYIIWTNGQKKPTRSKFYKRLTFSVGLPKGNTVLRRNFYNEMTIFSL